MPNFDYDQFMKTDIVNYDDLDSAVRQVITEAFTKMENAIDHFNEKNQDDIEVDTVDLSSKFDSIYDYVDDYID